MRKGAKKISVLVLSVLIFSALAVSPRRSAGQFPAPPQPSLPPGISSGTLVSASSGTFTGPINYTVNENVKDSGNTDVNAHAGCCG